MGRKTNSIGLRLKKTNKDYNHCWYSDNLYPYHFFKSLRVEDFFETSFKTINVSCPKISYIGAHKKSTFLVCYLDPNKRKTILQKALSPFSSDNKNLKNRPSGVFRVEFLKKKAKGFWNESLLNLAFSASSNSNGVPETLFLYNNPESFLDKRYKRTFLPYPHNFSFFGKTLDPKQKKKNSIDGGSLGLGFYNSSTLRSGFGLGARWPVETQKVRELNLLGKGAESFLPGKLVQKENGLYIQPFGIISQELLRPFVRAILTPKTFFSTKHKGEKLGDSGLNRLTSCNANHIFDSIGGKNFSFNPKILKYPKAKRVIIESKIPQDSKLYDYSSLSSFNFYPPGFRFGEKGSACITSFTNPYPLSIFFEKKKEKTAALHLLTSKMENNQSIFCALFSSLCLYGKRTLNPLPLATYGSKIVSSSSSFTKVKLKNSPFDLLVFRKNLLFYNLCKPNFDFFLGTQKCLSDFCKTNVSTYFYKTTNEKSSALFLAHTVSFLLERKVLFRSIKRLILQFLNKKKNSRKKGRGASTCIANPVERATFAPRGCSYGARPLGACPTGHDQTGVFQRSNHLAKKKIIGIRVSCSGRVGGRSKKAQRARKETFMWGETGLHIFSNYLDFAKTHAETPFGLIGVKVWVCTK